MFNSNDSYNTRHASHKPGQLITLDASLCLVISCGMIYPVTFKIQPFERYIYGSAIENSICTKYVTELK